MNIAKIRLQILTYVWASVLVTCLSQDRFAPNSCTIKRNCSECIRAACAWCFAPDFNGPRCFYPTDTAECMEEHIFNPNNEFLVDPSHDMELSRARSRMDVATAKAEQNLASVSTSTNDNLVQIKPQKIKLKMRMNEKQKIKFVYSRAQDYPVDLYYLMDLSSSMKCHREELSKLGSLLSSTMQNMTSNFRIGFGSFVDKVVMPFASTIPDSLISPCQDCAAPYGFRNDMSLSKDTDNFEKAVAKAKMSGNEDIPEGGFDAIMQAVVCTKQIGWRDHARRLLVFATDAGFHHAGDGKLGGIVEPNDGKCYMENNSYTHSTLQDYPSISQINLMVKENAINLIFAVTENQTGVYEELSQRIEGSSSRILSNDSNNVVDLVREQYNKITSTVEMKDPSSDAVQIEYYSSCLDNKELLRTNKCDGLKVGDVVEFTAEITLSECPTDRKKWRQTFDISPVGISDSLAVELEMVCDCPCEHPGHHAYNVSPSVCSGEGTSACGVCVCNSGRYGKQCECSATGGASKEHDRGCRPANVTSGPMCYGRGTCVCGVCECNKLDDALKVVSGPFCECDNFSCERYRGQICSGLGRGECVCGECVCRPGYTGFACQCDMDQSSCKSPENNEICSGNGKCVCGKCVCNLDGGKHYSGQYCEQCPTSPGRCGEFKDCVLCEVHKRGPLYDEEKGICGQCTLVPQIEEGKIEANESRNEHLCTYYDDENCLYVYVYSYDVSRRLVVRAQKETECPKKIPILGIILGLVAAIVLIGFALLVIWKIVTSVQDRREFARFEKERRTATWAAEVNPIYKQATTTFSNPTYAGK